MSGEERILDRFEGVRRLRDDQWMVLCPGHGDRNPSLHVTHREGRWLLYCHAGCELEDVLRGASLEQRDLFDERGNGRREIEAVYSYHDERDVPLFEVVRFQGKQFRQRTPDGSWGLNGTRRVLYQLPKVIEAVARGETIYVAEGEKDADALERLGFHATTNPMGAGKWRDEYSEALRGAKVTIVADRDEPGRDHARAVARALEGVAAEVAVLEPPRDKDVSDHIANGGAIGELKMLSSLGDQAVTKESGLPFTPVRDVIRNAPPEPEWVWDGYIAPGAVSLLAGRPKVGKSTLMFGLIAAVLQGRPFAARATRGRGVLLLTEESADTLAEKARMFEIGDHPSFHALLRRRVQAAWPEVGAGARAYCREHELGVIVVDTFDKWAGLRGDDENKSGPTLQALEPLMLASGDGLAVIIVSHQRKASGDHGEAVRGSNAMTGAVDVIMELERVTDVAHARGLYGTSRFVGTPEELAIELTEDGYVARGDVEALRERLDAEKVLGALTGTQWITADGVAEVIEMPKATVHKRLGALHDEGSVERRGEGRKGSPYEWRAHSSQPEEPVTKEPNGQKTLFPALESQKGGLEPEGEILSSQPDPLVTKEKPEAPEEHSSPAERDADVLELLGQADRLGVEMRLERDEFGPLDTTVWMSRNGYDELERSFYCRGTKANGERCTNKRKPASRYCGVHAPAQVSTFPGDQPDVIPGQSQLPLDGEEVS